MTQASTKLTLKPGKFDEVNEILINELDAMRGFDGLYDLSVTKVDDSTLVITATYFSTALRDTCAAADAALPLRTCLFSPRLSFPYLPMPL